MGCVVQSWWSCSLRPTNSESGSLPESICKVLTDETRDGEVGRGSGSFFSLQRWRRRRFESRFPLFNRPVELHFLHSSSRTWYPYSYCTCVSVTTVPETAPIISFSKPPYALSRNFFTVEVLFVFSIKLFSKLFHFFTPSTPAIFPIRTHSTKHDAAERIGDFTHRSPTRRLERE